MKILKSIAIFAFVSIFTISCKKEETNNHTNTTVENVIPENAKLETASLTIEGMTCEIGCAKTIESKLANTPGVKEATVNFEEKIAKVTFDSNQQNVVSLTKTIEDVAGGDTYKVSQSEIINN